ncbi:reverse transcriptase domain-containing protein [Tanacetum coccineum]
MTIMGTQCIVESFADEGSSNSNIDKIMARMDIMTMKMDARYKEFQSRSKQPNPDHNDDDKPMSLEKEAKFMQTFHRTHFYNDYHDRDSNRDNWHTFMDLKTKLETTTKNYQASIQNLEAKFDKLADRQSARPSGSLPSNTQPNPKGSSSKSYQPPQARNEHVNVVFTQSGKYYDPPINPNDQPNDSKNPVNFDSEDEDEEPTPQPKVKDPKPVKETLIPKPYKLKIPYPQGLRKEKMEAQYGKFLDTIRLVRINVPLVDVLVGMPNYGKFLKELVSNKHKLEQISFAFLSDESSAMIQNKVPPKLGDLESFLIPCNLSKAFLCNALADLAENMLVEVGKFTFPMDFVILEMEEDSKVPLILGRPFLNTADAIIRVKQEQLNLGVGTERMIFHIDSVMKHFYSNDDTCFSIDFIDEIFEEDFDALLDEGSKILHSIEETIIQSKLFAEFDEFMAMTVKENSESDSETKEPPFKNVTFNTDYKIKTSLKEPPSDLELKPLPDNLEYVFLEEPFFLPVIISSQLSKKNKNKVISVLKKHKQAFAWKTTDIPGICSYMLAIFHDMIEESVEVFMDDFSIFGNSFNNCLNKLDRILQRFKDVNLFLTGKNVTLWLKKELILEKTVKDNPAIWSRKLDDALWAFRNAYKTPTGTTPYKLVYGKNCHLPFEIEHRAYWALKNCNPDLIAAGEKRMFQLYELDEF